MSMTSAFQTHPHWPAVAKAIGVIEAAGFEALLAGGCVRDFIMGREPNDFDIATNATPEQLKPLFVRALEVGREFGVTILPEDGFQLEIATFRKDGPYLDGRRPSTIEFASSREDAARRDFTVNALFYDLKSKQILDFVGGQNDIRARVIRAVGEPERRFEEDKLRLLRAVRFAAQLDFVIESETLAAVCRLAPTLKVVSRERVRDEMVKLMKSKGRVRGLDLLAQSGLLWEIFPKFPQSASDLERLKISWSTTSELTVLWSLLLKRYFSNEHDLKNELRQLTLPTHQIAAITWVLKNSEGLARPRLLKLSTMVRILASEHSSAAIEFYACEAGPMMTDDLSFMAQVREIYLVNKRYLPDRWITGGDLQALGVRPGPEMGKLLEAAYDDQLEKKFLSRDELLASISSAHASRKRSP